MKLSWPSRVRSTATMTIFFCCCSGIPLLVTFTSSITISSLFYFAVIVCIQIQNKNKIHLSSILPNDDVVVVAYFSKVKTWQQSCLPRSLNIQELNNNKKCDKTCVSNVSYKKQAIVISKNFNSNFSTLIADDISKVIIEAVSSFNPVLCDCAKKSTLYRGLLFVVFEGRKLTGGSRCLLCL